MAKTDNLKKMKAVLELISELTGYNDDSLLEQDSIILLLKKLNKNISFDAATMYKYSNKNKELVNIGGIGGDVELLSQITLSAGAGLSGWAAESNKPILIADRSKKKSYNPETDFASFMSVPLLQKETVIGVINFGSYKPNVFTKDDLQLVQMLSGIISLILEKISYEQKYNNVVLKLKSSITNIDKLKEKSIDVDVVEHISSETSKIIHNINNSLSIILGNIQCMMISKSGLNQKMMSRVKRVEIAAQKISKANQQILALYDLVNSETNETKENMSLV